jgi:hypothetical protein
MKESFRHSRQAIDVVSRRTARHQRSSAEGTRGTSEFPRPGEVLVEVGLILAVHLAAAIAVILTLRAFGI